MAEGGGQPARRSWPRMHRLHGARSVYPDPSAFFAGIVNFGEKKAQEISRVETCL
jgi:hypothetical protein